MKNRLKQFIPLTLRQAIKRYLLALEDKRHPITTPRVPPRAMTYIGGGDFKNVGDHFLTVLQRHGLNPHMKILDVGCGQGRMARPLVPYIQDGHYTGFDISETNIDWCQKHYSDIPNFIFRHVPVYNQRYNPKGTIQASEFIFPYDDDQFDMVFLTSVFTHMFADDVKTYLEQIARVLKPGGQCLITWFLLNPISQNAKNPFYDFIFTYDKVSQTTTPKNPEAALAYDELFVKSAYEQYGLNITEIEYGRWAREDSPFQLQDMIIARKS